MSLQPDQYPPDGLIEKAATYLALGVLIAVGWVIDHKPGGHS